MKYCIRKFPPAKSGAGSPFELPFIHIFLLDDYNRYVDFLILNPSPTLPLSNKGRELYALNYRNIAHISFNPNIHL